MDNDGDEGDDLQALFDKIDTDHSGEISPEEAMKALHQYAAASNHTLTKRDKKAAERIFKRNDKDNSGGIDFEEFKGVVHDVEKYAGKAGSRQDRHDNLKDIFHKLDTDNDNKLSYPEVDAGFAGYAAQNNYTPTNADWKFVSKKFNKVGKNNATINFKQFKKLAKAIEKRFGDEE